MNVYTYMNVKKYFQNLTVYSYLNMLSKGVGAQVYITALLHRKGIESCKIVCILCLVKFCTMEILKLAEVHLGLTEYQVITKVPECFCYSVNSRFNQLSWSSKQILNKRCSYLSLKKSLGFFSFFLVEFIKEFSNNFGSLLLFLIKESYHGKNKRN